MTVELGIAIPSTMVTGDTVNTHAIVLSDEIKGGWHSVADDAALAAIPTPRLQVGMGAWVGPAATGKLKVWSGSIWVEFVQGGLAPSVQTLAQSLETKAATVTTYTCLVETTNNGLVALGGSAGKYGKPEFVNCTWTEGNVTGAATITYTWAIYIPGSDIIWAGNGGTKVHSINPSTMVSTDITAATGILVQAVYSAAQTKVYGFTSGSAVVKEMAPTTGTVARTYSPDATGNGYHHLVIDPTSGDLLLQGLNDGTGGCYLMRVALSTFNSVTTSAVAAGKALGLGSNNSHPIVCPTQSYVIFIDRGQASGNVWTYSGTPAYVKQLVGRYGFGGQGVYNSANSRVYFGYLANRNAIGRINPATASNMPTDTVVGLYSGNVAGTVSMLDMLIASDGNLYVLTSLQTVIQLTP